MKFSKVLEIRRSIRVYTDQPVKKEDIKKMLKAALLAPSWCNTESQRYYVVSDDKTLATMKENCLSPSNAQKSEKAPVLIVCGLVKDQSGFMEGQAADDLGNTWGFFDLGLGVENLLLQATALGLGTLVMGMRNEAALRKILSIPEEILLGPVIAVGYADETPEAPERKKLKDIAVFD